MNIKLSVENLHCAHCGEKITEAISKLEEVEQCSLNFLAKRFSITIKDEININEFVKKVNNLAQSIEDGVTIKNPSNVEKENLTLKLSVENLHCAHCAEKITEAISKLEEVKDCSLNFLAKRYLITVNGETNENDFIRKINDIAQGIEKEVIIKNPSKKIIPKHSDHTHINYSNENKVCHDSSCDCSSHHHQKESFVKKINFEKSFLVIGILLFISAYFIKVENIKMVVYLVAYFMVGSDVLYKSILNIKRKNFLDENFLMSIATIGSIGIGEYSEAVGVMIFYKIGEYFQDKAVNNSKNSIENLLKLKVVTANLKTSDGSIKKITPEEIRVNDILIIKAGESIPVDGVVVSGKSNLNLSALTGESLPIYIEENDEVLSGSINIDGVLEIKATKLYKNSTINKIVEMIEEAGDKKAHTEKFITKFAKYYTPVVVATALIVAFIFPLFLGDFKTWLGRSLIFLVISCPCALVLSVPLTFFSSIGYASKNGILIKGGNFLERLKNIEAVVFDKTGTLTENSFQIETISAFDSNSKEKVLELAKAGEIYSNHPLAKVILKYNDIKIDENNIKNYQEISGKGISCQYKNNSLLVGNKKLMIENNISLSNVSVEENSMIYIAENGILVGTISFNSIIKTNSKQTISDLSKMKVKSFMLTGDNEVSAKKIASSLNMDPENIYSNLLPQDKVATFEKIKTKNEGVIYIGDGINDAPVLSLADVGIAMGGMGSDIAIESADVVLLQDDPYKIVQLLKLAQLNKKVVFQNIVFSLGIKIIVMILGILGLANMWLAIFADVGVSLLAVLNASRILMTKKL